jgi:glutaredoxin 3
MQKVTIYSKDPCPYCVAAKNLLTQRGIAFTEIDMSDAPAEEFQALIKRSGMRTVPQIFHGDRLIGGFDSLSKLDSQDKLESLK